MNKRHQHVINGIKHWIEKVVIGHNFCPFAKKEWLNDRIAYGVCESNDHKDIVTQVLIDINTLENERTIETSLLIMPDTLVAFDDYLDCLDLAQWTLQRQGFEGKYQLASFHPHYQFNGVAAEAPENYTNRAPYPCFHLLREESVSKVLSKYPEPESIPENNIIQADTLGRSYFAKILNDCYRNNNSG